MSDKSQTCDARDCTVFKSATVEFPESDSDVQRHYCDEHMRHLLEMKVRFQGLNDHA